MAKEVANKVENLVIYADGTFKLSGVIAAYPTLLRPKAIMDNPTPKYSVSILIPKETHAEAIAELRRFIKKACDDKKFGKLASDKVCLRDGEDLNSEAYEPYWRLNLSANESHAPVLRIHGERKDRSEDSDELEEVCVMGAKVQVLGSLYMQDNQYGKRANGNLIAVNFTGGSVTLELGAGAADDDDVWDVDDDL